MRNFIVILILSAIAQMSFAQIVSSRSEDIVVTEQVKPKKPKTPRNFDFYIKAGVAMEKVTSPIDMSFKVGYDVDFGFMKPMGNDGAYWGMEAGVMSYSYLDGYGYTYSKMTAIVASPFVFGWHFKVNDNMTVSPFIAPFADYTIENAGWDFGLTAGAHLWFNKKVGLGLYVRKGFAETDHGVHMWDFDGNSANIETANLLKFVFSVGYAF